jgi:hypothetical protein
MCMASGYVVIELTVFMLSVVVSYRYAECRGINVMTYKI